MTIVDDLLAHSECCVGCQRGWDSLTEDTETDHDFEIDHNDDTFREHASYCELWRMKRSKDSDLDEALTVEATIECNGYTYLLLKERDSSHPWYMMDYYAEEFRGGYSTALDAVEALDLEPDDEYAWSCDNEVLRVQLGFRGNEVALMDVIAAASLNLSPEMDFSHDRGVINLALTLLGITDEDIKPQVEALIRGH